MSPLIQTSVGIRWFPLNEGMPGHCWVRQVATKRRNRKYWVDNRDSTLLYVWDLLHQNQKSAHVEIYKIAHGTKYAYLVAEADPFNPSRDLWKMPIGKQGRRIEV